MSISKWGVLTEFCQIAVVGNLSLAMGLVDFSFREGTVYKNTC